MNHLADTHVVAPPQAPAAPPIKCRVSVKTADGGQTYDGLFPSTWAAVIAAQDRIGLRPCRISARALP
ncbi:hypothetical protein D5039_21985 [Verminephrobacter aporrectodeae subsp. tuberculatae]|uniref:Uncharacterized protein n=1 Tax=Verminephrobacter aporrectodeae subsp. tuberculatae TaxID=1110392 RepID=A0ABT3KZE2_9BURK|nr:hypothetical protein [Verminephrobacter aporrectodeae]MCW5323713.1 hypothetical protein [Verminephrobacter aporrectodeae subsp. tuberculatae]